MLFRKMHGLGNDFIIIDARQSPISLSSTEIEHWCARRTGIGADQLVLLTPSTVIFYNADGSESGACGNASRCVAKIFHEETGERQGSFATKAGRLQWWAEGDETYTIDMGIPRLAWQDIPLTTAVNTEAIPVPTQQHFPSLSTGFAVNMGNPHLVFFVENVENIPLAEWGEILEYHPLFPERTNVEFVEKRAPHTLRMRVWERGAGITPACGSGACAAMVAAYQLGHIEGRQAEVVLDGGSLEITYQENGHVHMRGTATEVFRGEI